jgi:hypothetical protein
VHFVAAPDRQAGNMPTSAKGLYVNSLSPFSPAPIIGFTRSSPVLEERKHKTWWHRRPRLDDAIRASVPSDDACSPRIS